MMRHTFKLFVLVPVLFLFAPAASQGQTEKAGTPLRIGMSKSLLVDVPDMLVDLFKKSFGKLVKEFTGFEGELVIVDTPFELARKIEAGEIDLGVMQGVECAWTKTRHAELDPFLLLVTKHPKVHAQVVVRKDSDIASCADLKGKDVAFPLKNKEHCRLFMQRLCTEAGMDDPKAFFSKVCRANNSEKALDELAAGKLHAVLTDKVNIEFYQRLKPGQAGQIKVLETSKSFPTAVILTKRGALNEKQLTQIRNGLLKANKSERGQELMLAWEITEIAPVAEDYARDLDAILRVHPAPESAVSRR